MVATYVSVTHYIAIRLLLVLIKDLHMVNLWHEFVHK